MYPNLDSDGELTGLLIAHVGDLLFCGTPGFRKVAIRPIQTSRTGEVETMSKTTPIIFTGLMIELETSGTLLFPHQMHAGELSMVRIAEYLGRTGIANLAGLKSTPKQGLGILSGYIKHARALDSRSLRWIRNFRTRAPQRKKLRNWRICTARLRSSPKPYSGDSLRRTPDSHS